MYLLLLRFFGRLLGGLPFSFLFRLLDGVDVVLSTLLDQLDGFFEFRYREGYRHLNLIEEVDGLEGVIK